MNQLDLRLYAILDPEHAGGRSLVDLAREVAAGGATLIQLRDKSNDPPTTIALAKAIKAALAPNVPLIVNDNVEVAMAAQADGVHLGQEDMPVAKARQRLGPASIVGLSVKTRQQAQTAPLALIDYVGIGGVFATTSKDNPHAPIGLAGLHEIAAVFRDRNKDFPLCAIAGITERNAADVVMAGADGVAVISALSLAPDPRAAAQRLRAIVDETLRKRSPRA